MQSSHHNPFINMSLELDSKTHVYKNTVTCFCKNETKTSSDVRVDYWLGSDIVSSYATKCSISGPPPP